MPLERAREERPPGLRVRRRPEGQADRCRADHWRDVERAGAGAAQGGCDASGGLGRRWAAACDVPDLRSFANPESRAHGPPSPTGAGKREHLRTSDPATRGARTGPRLSHRDMVSSPAGRASSQRAHCVRRRMNALELTRRRVTRSGSPVSGAHRAAPCNSCRPPGPSSRRPALTGLRIHGSFDRGHGG